MTDVTIREIQDLRELADPPAPRPEPDPDEAKAAGEELLAEATHAMLARTRRPGSLDRAGLRELGLGLGFGLRAFVRLRARLRLARLDVRHLRLNLGRGSSGSAVSARAALLPVSTPAPGTRAAQARVCAFSAISRVSAVESDHAS